jgi:hypothetical protein
MEIDYNRSPMTVRQLFRTMTNFWTNMAFAKIMDSGLATITKKSLKLSSVNSIQIIQLFNANARRFCGPCEGQSKHCKTRGYDNSSDHNAGK